MQQDTKHEGESCKNCKLAKGDPRPSMAGDEYLCTNSQHCTCEILASGEDEGELQDEFDRLGGLWLLDWGELGAYEDCPNLERRI